MMFLYKHTYQVNWSTLACIGIQTNDWDNALLPKLLLSKIARILCDKTHRMLQTFSMRICIHELTSVVASEWVCLQYMIPICGSVYV